MNLVKGGGGAGEGNKAVRGVVILSHTMYLERKIKVNFARKDRRKSEMEREREKMEKREGKN